MGKEDNKAGGMSLGDLSIYLKNESVAKLTGVVNGLYPQGSKLKLGQHPLQSDWTYVTTREPGILSVGWIPNPGVATTAKDPINASGSKRFNQLRDNNWSQNYADIADMTFHFIAADSLYILHQMAGNIYTHLDIVDNVDLYQPEGIFKAYHLNHHDFELHKAELLNLIKKMQGKIGLMKIPRALGYTKRHLAMMNAIYMDRPINKSQKIVFAPLGVWKYNLSSMQLEWVPLRLDHDMTYLEFETIMEDLLNAMLPDEEIQRLNADILNYITTDVYTIADLSWDQMKKPIYDESVIEQLHNAEFLPYSSVTNMNITQKVTSTYDSIIIWNPTFTTNEIGVLSENVIDVAELQPDYKSVLQSTLFKFKAKLVGNMPAARGGSFTVQLESCGSELLANVELVIMASEDDATSGQTDGEMMVMPLSSYINLLTFSYNSHTWMGWQFRSELATDMPMNKIPIDYLSMVYLTKFNRAPIQKLFTTTNAAGGALLFEYVGMLGEIANTIHIDKVQLKAIQEQNLLSLFDVTTSNTKK